MSLKDLPSASRRELRALMRAALAAQDWRAGPPISAEAAVAVRKLAGASAGGDVELMVFYGYLLQSGILGRRYCVRATRLFLKAARMGYLPGIYNAAVAKIWGAGCIANPRLGVRLLGRGAGAGDTDSILLLGKLLFRGKVTRQNKARGIKLLREAARLGDREGKLLVRRYDASGNIDPSRRSGQRA